MRSKTTVLYIVTLTIGVIALINVLANRFFVRLDLTEDNRFTLSRATKDLLRNLEEPVTITAYFTKKLDPSFDNIRKEFEDLLTEYHSISKGMVVYEIKNPLKDEKTEQEAQQAGVMELQVQVREDDQFKAQKAYLGAVVQMGEESEVIPAIGQTQGMEYSLSTAIKKLSVKEKPVIGIMQGHGEPSLQQLQQTINAMEVLDLVEPVYLNDSTELSNYEAVAIIAPKDSFSQRQLDLLSQFLASGKGIFVAINRVGADQNNQWGIPITTGLEGWLNQLGIEVGNNYIVDVQCPTLMLQQQQGQYVSIKPVHFYYIPYIYNFSDHPISSGLEQVVLQFASPVSYTGDSAAVTFTPLARTSEKSGTKSSYSLYEVDKEWTENDFPLSNLTVAATLEGKIAGNTNARMVIVGDGDLPVVGDQGQVNPDNINLMVNAIDWLSDETGLIELRTKGATLRPLDELEDGKRKFLKYLNFSLPLVLVIIYGIVRMQRNQLIKIKRMEVGHV